MSLPPELKKNAPKKKKKAQGKEVMHELKHGPVTAPSRKATSGEQRHKQDVAIMLKNTGQSDKMESKKAPPMGKKKKHGNKARA